MKKQFLGYSRGPDGKVTSRHIKPLSNTLTTFIGSGNTTDSYIITIRKI